jgi:hypothetical protein
MSFLFYKQLDAMPACQPRLVNRLGRDCGVFCVPNKKNSSHVLSLL